MYIVYYSQGIDIQLLWHIWLSESESFVAKLTSAASEFDDLPTLILTHIYGLLLFFHLFPIYIYICFCKISISCPVLIQQMKLICGDELNGCVG